MYAPDHHGRGWAPRGSINMDLVGGAGTMSSSANGGSDGRRGALRIPKGAAN